MHRVRFFFFEIARQTLRGPTKKVSRKTPLFKLFLPNGSIGRGRSGRIKTRLCITHTIRKEKSRPCEIASSHARKIRDFLLFFPLSPLPLEVPLSSSLRQRLKNGGGRGRGKKEPCAAKNRLSLFSGEEFSR